LSPFGGLNSGTTLYLKWSESLICNQFLQLFEYCVSRDLQRLLTLTGQRKIFIFMYCVISNMFTAPSQRKLFIFMYCVISNMFTGPTLFLSVMAYGPVSFT